MKEFLIFLLMCGSTLATQKNLICKSVEDVFVEPDETGAGSRTAAVQGRSGKRGPPGVRGEPGPQGNQGAPGNNATVDYEIISKKIDDKIREGLDAMRSVVQELQQNFSALQRDFAGGSCGESGGLSYDGKCFSIPDFSESYDLSYNDAKEKCRQVGSSLAEIHSRSQQRAMYRYVRSKMTGSLWQIWIGMTYRSSDSTLQYKSSIKIPINELQWHPNYPRGSSGVMAINIHSSERSNDGLWNGYSSNLQGVICEKKL